MNVGKHAETGLEMRAVGRSLINLLLCLLEVKTELFYIKLQHILLINFDNEVGVPVFKRIIRRLFPEMAALESFMINLYYSLLPSTIPLDSSISLPDV